MSRYIFCIIAMSLMLFLFTCNFVGAGKHPNNEFIFEIGENVANILRNYNIKVQRDGEAGFDFDEGFVMYSDGSDSLFGGNKSYSIYLYKASHIPLAARVEIVAYCMRIYEERGRKEQYTVTMRSQEFKPGISQPEPFFRLTLKAEDIKE